MRWVILGSILLGLLVFELQGLSKQAFSDPTNKSQENATSDRCNRDRYGDPLPEFAVARLGTLRLRQEGEVNSIAFAPDGKTVAAVSGESDILSLGIRLWSVADGHLIRRLDLSKVRTNDPFFCCQPSEGSQPVFSPDGNTLSLPCRTKVLVWDFKRKNRYRLLGEEQRYVNGCAFSPDGKLLACGSVVPGPSGPLEKLIEVYDVTTGKLTQKIVVPARVESLCVSPKDNFVVAVLQNHTVGIWDIAKGTQVQLLKSPAAGFHLATFSLDGKTVATVTENNFLSIWSVDSGKCLQKISASMDGILDMAFVPPGKMLATLGDYYITIWDMASGKPLDRVKAPESCRHIAFSPNGKLLAGATGCAIELRQFPQNTDPLDIQGHTDQIPFMAFLSDGTLVSWGRDRKTLLWDRATAKPIWERRSNDDSYVPLGLQAIAVSPLRDRLAIECRGGNIEIWNLAEKKREKSLPVATKQLVNALQFSPDGNSLACGDRGGNLLIFDVQADRVIRKWTRDEWMGKNKTEEKWTESLPWYDNQEIRMSIMDNNREIQSLAWLKDGKTVIAATSYMVGWLNVQTGKLIRKSSGKPEETYQRYIVVAPNGRLLAELDDGYCTVIKTADGQEVWSDKNNNDGPIFSSSAIAFSPDSTLLAGSLGNSIRLIDANTGKERANIATDQENVEGIAFSGDGVFLATSGRNGTILVFDVAKVLV